MTDDRTRQWWDTACAIWEEHKRDEWRAAMPRKTHTHSQRVLLAIMFNSSQRQLNPDQPTGAFFPSWLNDWSKWLKTYQGDARTTIWTTLESFAGGQGSQSAGDPAVTVVNALKALPRDEQKRLLWRLLGELI
jgi:hypothetical protein